MKKESNLDIFINASSLHTDIHGNANIHFIFIIIYMYHRIYYQVHQTFFKKNYRKYAIKKNIGNSHSRDGF